MKFGGTSNQDAAAMRNVISIIQSHLQKRPVVVISAIAKATNELEQIARAAATGKAADAEKILKSLFQRHDRIVNDLLTSPERRKDALTAFQSHREELSRLIQGVSILKELTPRTMDAFCSHGERLSSRIVTAALQEAGVPAVWVDAADFMITDDGFGRARPLMDLVSENLRRTVAPLVSNGKVPVTQGFIGITQSGAYTTMGRESSDYSASIIGAAMDAELVQIWTDVDGILTADPAVVGPIKRIRRLSFQEAFELSYFGAKVLHPNTMLPVLAKGIPVEIRNSRRQDGLGTLVDSEGTLPTGAGIIKSIAFRKGLTLIVVKPQKRFSQYVFWEGIFSVLTRFGVATGITATSEFSIAFTLDANSDIEGLKSQLEEFGPVDVFPGMGSICLVGSGLRGKSGMTKNVFDALAGMSVMMVSYGASDLNLTLVLGETQIVEALNRLHAQFFDAANAPEIFDAPAL